MGKSSRRGSTNSSGLLLGLGALLVLAVVVFIEMAVLMNGLHRLFNCSSSAPIVASEDAGRLRTAHFIDQLIRHETIVDTEKGSFVVCGTFPAITGHALVLERRRDGNRMLCDPAEKICARLVQ